jgi:hypothetical protein
MTLSAENSQWLFSVKIWITKIWGMVPAGIQFLIFVYSRFSHAALEIFLPFSNVKKKKIFDFPRPSWGFVFRLPL